MSARQTVAVMKRFEPVVLKEKPDWVLVVGIRKFSIVTTAFSKRLSCQ